MSKRIPPRDEVAAEDVAPHRRVSGSVYTLSLISGKVTNSVISEQRWATPRPSV